MLFIQYLQQQGEAVVLEAIDKPDKEYKEFIDPEGLAKVVMDVNQCEEMIPEYLSDHLYYYGGKDVPLQIVSDSCGFPD